MEQVHQFASVITSVKDHQHRMFLSRRFRSFPPWNQGHVMTQVGSGQRTLVTVAGDIHPLGNMDGGRAPIIQFSVEFHYED